VEKTRTANEKVEEISSDIEREAIAVSQIAAGIEQISVVVQHNSATAEESAAASEELSGQAQMLKELISGFKLSENHRYGPAKIIGRAMEKPSLYQQRTAQAIFFFWQILKQ
jgi:hypothetical protein